MEEPTHITSCWEIKVSYMACYVFNSVRVEFLLTFSAKLFEINLVGEVRVIEGKRMQAPSAISMPYLICALDAPHVRALPPEVTRSAVIISVLLFQKLDTTVKV